MHGPQFEHLLVVEDPVSHQLFLLFEGYLLNSTPEFYLQYVHLDFLVVEDHVRGHQLFLLFEGYLLNSTPEFYLQYVQPLPIHHWKVNENN